MTKTSGLLILLYCVLVSAFECLFFCFFRCTSEMGNRKKSKSNTAQLSATDLGDQGEEDEYITIAMVKQLKV